MLAKGGIADALRVMTACRGGGPSYGVAAFSRGQEALAATLRAGSPATLSERCALLHVSSYFVVAEEAVPGIVDAIAAAAPADFQPADVQHMLQGCAGWDVAAGGDHRLPLLAVAVAADGSAAALCDVVTTLPAVYGATRVESVDGAAADALTAHDGWGWVQGALALPVVSVIDTWPLTTSSVLQRAAPAPLLDARGGGAAADVLRFLFAAAKLSGEGSSAAVAAAARQLCGVAQQLSLHQAVQAAEWCVEARSDAAAAQLLPLVVLQGATLGLPKWSDTRRTFDLDVVRFAGRWLRVATTCSPTHHAAIGAALHVVISREEFRGPLRAWLSLTPAALRALNSTSVQRALHADSAKFVRETICLR
jgi:hypothetical protein